MRACRNDDISRVDAVVIWEASFSIVNMNCWIIEEPVCTRLHMFGKATINNNNLFYAA